MPRSGIINLSNLQTFTAVNVLSDPGGIPGPVVIPQAAQIVFNWTLADGKIAHNVIYGRYSGGFAGTPAQAIAIATALTTGTAWTTLAGFLGTTTTFAGVTLRDVNTANQPIIGGAFTPVPGTGAGTELPDEVAAVITLRTAQVGPGFRGRIYIPGWVTSAVGAGNVIAAGAVTALGTWANTIPTALTGSGYTFVLGQKARAQYTSPSTGRVHPARPANTVAITSQTVRDNHWDTQRRRGLK